jgi:glycosyltransferase involved in cell wall biosynthesis
MKIHAYIITWNEGKILPFTLDHYSKFCEKIFIYDNMSTDNTDEICSKYSNVKVIKWSTPDKKYNDITLAEMKSNVYKQSRKDNIDWVIMCDCDEYLYHENLLEKLAEYKETGITMPLIDGHDMFSETFPEYDGELLTDKVKIGSETYAPMCKNIVFDPILDITYMPGAHSNQCPNAVKSTSSEIKLLHYKFLSKEYVLDRYNQLAEQLSDFNKKTGLSGHWTRPPMKYMDEMKEKNYKVI